MAMICRELIKLSSLKDLKIVAGTSGLDRPVRWIYVAECFEDTRQIVDWLYGGELVFITGLGIKGNIEILVDLIRKISEKNVSGLIINVGPYIPEIPQEVVQEGDRLGLPLFELPWETKLVNITRDICSAIVLKDMEEKSLDNLLENILFSASDIDENLIGRAAYYGYNLTGMCQVCIADIDHFAAFLKKKHIENENDIMEIKLNIKRIIQQTMLKNSKSVLLMLRSDSIICLIQAQGEMAEDFIVKLFEEIRSAVGIAFPGLTISVGVGNPYSELRDMKKSLEEAEQALKAGICIYSNNATCFFKKLGIYAILFNVKDQKVLEKFYLDTLGTIIEYDRLNTAALFHTLETYLEESGNLKEIAEKLFVHKNTLKYRMGKIEEISGYDMRSTHDCTKLEVAVMIGKLLARNGK